ncbi:protoporphyrinogen/coproporphyrinogen oxidase [Amycolatopsis pithecellobii]|uniref:protoporphyrinogen/coproporphyrinogen oxidase n=1 Tax=Amycolatopsis pithecellobii TaxID=664692 RepID=UPI001409A93A|nr:FAD-dependent oxidoreductase [Amycolatopsis pithecellobii]
MKRAVVVGSGISGLAAAWKLTRQGWQVTVLERDQWIGGRVRRVAYEGMDIDVGAAFVTDFYFHARKIMREIGLENELVRFSLDSAVEHDGKLKSLWPLPEMVAEGLLPVTALVRLAAGTMTLAPKWLSLNPGDLDAGIAYDDETAQSWSERVYGAEVTERVIKPLLRGVVHWDAETTSRAVLFAMLKAFLAHPRAYVPRTGMAALPLAMADGLTVQTGARVTGIVRSGTGWAVHCDRDGGPETFEADAVVCSAPATQVADLVPELSHVDKEFFAGVRYSSTAVAVVKVDGKPDTLRKSVWFTMQDQSSIVGMTPYLFRDDDRDYSIVRISLSDPAYRGNAGMSDGELGQFVIDSARRMPQLSTLLRSGSVVGLARWPEALPVFDVGHLKKVRSWRSRNSGSLVFAGDYLRGPYLEGAVRSGLEAAARLG